MATPLRQQRLSLAEQLFAKPYEFEFPQAVKLIELLYPEKVSVAIGPDASLEALRIHSNILLSTPPSDVFTLTAPSFGVAQAQLTINFMGIAGQTGPLPNVYSELILDRIKAKDYAFRDFLDLFNHRLNGIHYRIHAKHNLSLTKGSPETSQAAQILLALTGLTAGFQGGARGALMALDYGSSRRQKGQRKGFGNGQDPLVPLRGYVKYAGLFWQKPRSAIGLETLLQDYFQRTIRVVQFQGAWTPLEHDQCTRIGKKGRFHVLGETTSLGDKVWVQGDKITLHIGDLSLSDYTHFLPKGALNKRVSHVTRQYLGWENGFDFSLSLQRGQAVPCALDGTAALGWTSWMMDPSAPYEPEAINVAANDPLTIS